jgi:hypothetical protein
MSIGQIYMDFFVQWKALYLSWEESVMLTFRGLYLWLFRGFIIFLSRKLVIVSSFSINLCLKNVRNTKFATATRTTLAFSPPDVIHRMPIRSKLSLRICLACVWFWDYLGWVDSILVLWVGLIPFIVWLLGRGYPLFFVWLEENEMWVEVPDTRSPHVNLISLIACFSSSPTGAPPTLHATARTRSSISDEHPFRPREPDLRRAADLCPRQSFARTS